MKEYPIIFSTELIPKILDGTKTMTRRTAGLEIINLHPEAWQVVWNEGDLWAFSNEAKEEALTLKCPYGQVGDRLWVRETFVLESDLEYGYTTEELKRWAKDRPIKTIPDDGYWGEYHLIPHYRATEPEPNLVTEEQFEDMDDKTRWTPSIHMPRWASRITLEITEVRAERLNSMTESDTHLEGVDNLVTFMLLWDRLNKKRGYEWTSDCWVWVLTFKLCQ